MRPALIFFVAVMASVLTHLSYLFGRSWLWLLPAVPLFFFVWWLFRARPAIMLKGLMAANVAVLLLVSVFLSTQVWLLLTLNQVQLAAGHVLPLFIGTLLLYLYSVFLSYDLGQGNTTEKKKDTSLECVAQPISGPPVVTTLCVAMVVSAYTLLLLHNVALEISWLNSVKVRFLDRGIIPPITLLLFFWALLLLLGKWGGGWYVRGVLNGASSKAPLAQTITATLATLSRRPSLAPSQMRLLWRRSGESYLLPRYINWAVPILGFIGTVLGISLAADGIRRIISATDGLSQMSGDLGQAIAPLGIAFDTTLIALSLSVVLTLIQTLVQRNEERLLSDIETGLKTD